MRYALFIVKPQALRAQRVKRQIAALLCHAVKRVRFDIRQDLRRQIPLRAVKREHPPHCGGRQLQGVIFRHHDPCAQRFQSLRLLRELTTQRRARLAAVHTHELRHARDLVRLAPALKGQKHIRPHQKQQLVRGILCLKLAQSIHRVAFSAALKL